MTEKDDKKMKYGTISLPMPLIEKVKGKIEGTGIPSVSSYVAFILREILSYSDEDKGKMDKKSEMELRQRLRNLGYI